MKYDDYLKQVRERAERATRQIRALCEGVRVLAPAFKFSLPAAVAECESSFLGGAASAGPKGPPPTIFQDIEVMTARIDELTAALKDLLVENTWQSVKRARAVLEKEVAG